MKIGEKYVIIGSWNGHNGKVVTVTGYAGKALDFGISPLTGDRWFVDSFFKTNKGNFINHFGEKQLKPLGDQHLSSWEALEGIWTPELIINK